MKTLLVSTLFILALITAKPLLAQHTVVYTPNADVYFITFGGGEGKNSFLKFDISSIPLGNAITNVKLDINVLERSTAWDDDVMFIHVDNQTWLENYVIDSLWNTLSFSDTITQSMGFASALGWTSSIDIKDILLNDYNIGNNYFTVYLKDPDDGTFAPMSGSIPTEDSVDSLMVGDIFNNYIVFLPHEYSNPTLIPQLTVDYIIIPDINNQSSDISICEGDSMSFFISATGDSIIYQWQKDGVDIISATDSLFTISSVAISDAANYTCIVSNIGGYDTSDVMILTVYPLPIVDLGADTIICAGDIILLDAGAGYVSYIWSTGGMTQTILIDSSGTGIVTVSVYVTVTDLNPCLGTDTINITFEDCVGIKEIEYDRINIFPNPTTGIITIKAENINKIEVSDIHGREVYTGRNNTIDLSQEPQGIYIIRVTTDKYEVFSKVLLE